LGIQNIRAAQEAKAWFRESMGSVITLNHIEVGKEEGMISGSTCEGLRNNSSHTIKDWRERFNAKWP
jgi:hypothetical protein